MGLRRYEPRLSSVVARGLVVARAAPPSWPLAGLSAPPAAAFVPALGRFFTDAGVTAAAVSDPIYRWVDFRETNPATPVYPYLEQTTLASRPTLSTVNGKLVAACTAQWFRVVNLSLGLGLWVSVPCNMTGPANANAPLGVTTGGRITVYNAGGTYNVFAVGNYDSGVAQGKKVVAVGAAVTTGAITLRIAGTEYATGQTTTGPLSAWRAGADGDDSRPLNGYLAGMTALAYTPTAGDKTLVESYGTGLLP